MYRIVGPRMCTKSKCFASVISTPSAVAKACWFGLKEGGLRDNTRFIKASASWSRPLNVRPCFVSMIKSMPTKWRSKGARSVAAEDDGCALVDGLLAVAEGCCVDGIVEEDLLCCDCQNVTRGSSR